MSFGMCATLVRWCLLTPDNRRTHSDNNRTRGVVILKEFRSAYAAIPAVLAARSAQALMSVAQRRWQGAAMSAESVLTPQTKQQGQEELEAPVAAAAVVAVVLRGRRTGEVGLGREAEIERERI